MTTSRLHLTARVLAICGLMLPLQCLAQTKTAAAPQFEVASIKASDPSTTRPGRMGTVQIVTSPGRLTARSVYLKELIKAAYNLDDYQIFGGPDWIASARFDIEARSPGSATRGELLLMLRPLLAERFKLAGHHETKEIAIYALTVAKNGPKFKPLTASQASCWPGCADSPAKTNVMRQPDLPSLATFLTRLGSDRPVIDRTGLSGKFALEFDMSQILEEAGRSGGTNGAMFEAAANAIQDKLGLKLIPAKAPIDIFVVDHAEKPSSN